jgi:hypothetical protein
MTTARVLFLARYRVPHACMSLQFDRFLEGIDHTVISTPMPAQELEPVFAKYNIDSSNFEYVYDQDIFSLYPEINHWVFENDYRGWWLRQQAIKLSVIDHLNYDVMLMQDPDTFLIEPYRCWNGERLNYMVLENTTHGSYNGMIESIFGFPRQTPHCFITEFVPVLKDNHTLMREYLEQQHGINWLDAMIEHTTQMATIPPWGTGEIIRWFSEYEVVGNWAAHQAPIDYTFQRRYEYDTMQKLSNLSRDYNAVADAIPDLGQSLQFDWEQQEVIDFDRWLDLINEKIS